MAGVPVKFRCFQCNRLLGVALSKVGSVVSCPKCGGHVHKLMSAPAFTFKGSGWYITDYAKKDSSASSSGKSENSSASGSGDNSGSSSSFPISSKRVHRKADSLPAIRRPT